MNDTTVRIRLTLFFEGDITPVISKNIHRFFFLLKLTIKGVIKRIYMHKFKRTNFIKFHGDQQVLKRPKMYFFFLVLFL